MASRTSPTCPAPPQPPDRDVTGAGIILASSPDIDIGPVRILPSRRLVSHADGREAVVEPRAMKVMVALLRSPGRVLTRDDLFDSCWEGRAVSDDAIDRAIARLRRAVQPLADGVFTIETVTKVGHRLVLAPGGHGPVPAPTAAAPDAAPPSERAPAGTPSLGARGRIERPRWLLPCALLLLAVVGLAAGMWQQREREPAVAVAVLPFRSLTNGGDAYFAEGLGEEIMAQLARQPGLRVAGRTSSQQFKGETADLGEVVRKLGVTHVLEGSVRSADGRVRVNVALVQASTGMQLWAGTFDGTLDDVFTIQQRIGADVAAALGWRLVEAAPAVRRATSGAVYSLYLGARGRIRERNPIAMAVARERLVRALRLDPAFAPAWSSLAQITRFESNSPGPESERGREQAIRQARRALSLAPDLAEAHGVMGMLLGFDHRQGARHVKRAAALDPGNAEFQFWLGHVFANERDFPRSLKAYRTAFEIDPLWHYAQYQLVESAWEMGHREEAIRYVRRIERDGSRQQAHLNRATLAGARGDFSGQAAELAAAAAATGDAGKRTGAAYERAFVLFSLGLFDEARAEWSEGWDAAGIAAMRPQRMAEYEHHFAIRQGRLPSLAELRTRGRSAFDKDRSYATIGAKLLINAGRAADVVALYDGPDGFLGLARPPGSGGFSARLTDGPIVAAALRAVGRTEEADAILLRFDAIIAAGLARSGGQAPSTFLAEAATVWTMRGNHDAALSALEQARRRGWAYVEPDEGDTSLPDIGDEPAFRSLRGQPRFERLRAELRAHLDRERREVALQIARPAA
ncbi:winged helix-turn-helix domain-containing protein [Enterovirga sp. GCM10030262]|uniref:winged helix-turn-helix domain-containing protein n=1 Tax=Enterovirga sp. GCM10030262 TaxID=3273391 RepID=UPI00360DB901